MDNLDGLLGQQLGSLTLGSDPYSPIVSGGVVLSGIALVSRRFTATGGVVLNNEAVSVQRGTVYRFLADNTNPIFLNGQFVLRSRSFKYRPTAGISLNGSCLSKYFSVFKYTASLDLISVAGSSGSRYSLNKKYVATAGIVTGGTLILRRSWKHVVSGQILLGGSGNCKTSSQVWRYTGSSGVSLAGISPRSVGTKFTAARTFSSVIFPDGVAKAVFGRVAKGTGGILLSGSCLVRIPSLNVIPQGEITLGGSALVLLRLRVYRYEGSGDIFLDSLTETKTTYFDRNCNARFVCTVDDLTNGKYRDCFEPQFVNNNYGTLKLNYNPNNGAFIPAVTICRQRFIIPPPPEKRRAKKWSAKQFS